MEPSIHDFQFIQETECLLIQKIPSAITDGIWIQIPCSRPPILSRIRHSTLSISTECPSLNWWLSRTSFAALSAAHSSADTSSGGCSSSTTSLNPQPSQLTRNRAMLHTLMATFPYLLVRIFENSALPMPAPDATRIEWTVQLMRTHLLPLQTSLQKIPSVRTRYRRLPTNWHVERRVRTYGTLS
jgi:hypothetical protein